MICKGEFRKCIHTFNVWTFSVFCNKCTWLSLYFNFIFSIHRFPKSSQKIEWILKKKENRVLKNSEMWSVQNIKSWFTKRVYKILLKICHKKKAKFKWAEKPTNFDFFFFFFRNRFSLTENKSLKVVPR